MLRAFISGVSERRTPDNPYTSKGLRIAYLLGAAIGWRHWESWAYDGPRERHPILSRLSRH